jgi:membrane protein implicated in regulation of membrane protease activity
MITIAIEDWVFVVCMLVGGGLLLITVLVDDILGGLLDALNIGFDIGGVSLMPLALSFVSMFGVGGLFATQILGLHGSQAALVGAVFGSVGFGLAWALFGLLQRSEGEAPFSTESLVGRTASVVVAIPAGHLGSVIVRAQGRTHEYSATAEADIPAGQVVSITGVAGSALIVRAGAAPVVPSAPPAGGEGGNGDA